MHTLSLPLLALFLFAGTLYCQPCGTERWRVKTLTDNDAEHVNFDQPVITTVEALARPNSLRYRERDVRLPEERTVVRVRAWILGYKSEDDRDLHLVIADPATGTTMVAELPDPDCEEVARTRWAERYRVLREWIRRKVGKYESRTATPQLVRMEGVMFLDQQHGQTGMAASGFEMHPVLSIDTTLRQPRERRETLAESEVFLFGEHDSVIARQAEPVWCSVERSGDSLRVSQRGVSTVVRDSVGHYTITLEQPIEAQRGAVLSGANETSVIVSAKLNGEQTLRVTVMTLTGMFVDAPFSVAVFSR